MVKYLLLIVGFVLLIKGADFFVDGSSAVAKRLKVPSLIIGMTIVAMGTSLPETSVSVSASLLGKNDLAISNAVGSNIFNLMVVCGVCAVLCPMAVSKDTLKKDIPFSVLAAAVLLGLGAFTGVVRRWGGIILLALFAVFLYMMISSAKKARASGEAAEEDECRRVRDEAQHPGRHYQFVELADDGQSCGESVRPEVVFVPFFDMHHLLSSQAFTDTVDFSPGVIPRKTHMSG